MTPLQAARVGEVGFASFLYELQCLGVLDRGELRGWLALHGAALRAVEPPDEAALLRELDALGARPIERDLR